MVKKILMGLAALLVAFAAFVATRPSTFKVERTGTVTASADVAYALVADFHNWAKWSPWDKLDPTMKKTFSGAPSGEGAGYAWVGKDQVGEGAMTITAVRPNDQIVIRLEFKKPFPATNKTTFSFKPAGTSTQVSWTMEGENNFMGKAFSVFMNMDKMVGGDFEKGLASLDVVAQAETKRRADEAAKAAAAEQAAPSAGQPAPGPVAGAALPRP
jgi:uncharacterized protein YndB with AHSA1/START domain